MSNTGKRPHVMPAKAGIQRFGSDISRTWIPASAGMTKRVFNLHKTIERHDITAVQSLSKFGFGQEWVI